MLFAIPRPWRRRELPRGPKPCPLCQCDLQAQARHLLEHGYLVAAVATSRCELESRLKVVAHKVDALHGGTGFRSTWQSRACADLLRRYGLLTTPQVHRIRAAQRRAGDIVHNAAKVNCLRARWVVAEIETLVGELHAAIERGIEPPARSPGAVPLAV